MSTYRKRFSCIIPLKVLSYLLFSFVLTGCAALPLNKATAYLKDLYRRIPYTIEGKYRVLEIYFATSRKVTMGPDGDFNFRPELADGLTYGRMSVKIDPNLKIGKMTPAQLKRRGTIGIQKITELDRDAFLKELTDKVKKSPHDSLLVLVHGFKDGFDFNSIKSAYFSYLLDVNTPVFMFDWPGDLGLSISGYKKAESFAVQSGPYLGEVLADVIRNIKPGKIWVQAHSLGCLVACSAFEEMYKKEDLVDAENEIEHVVFAAPDVGQDEFDDEFKNEIAALSKKLTVYVSSDDDALVMSSFINDDKRVGLQKERLKDPGQFEESKDILYLKSLDPDRIALIDVTPINDSSYGHGYYLESADYYDDFYMRILDQDPHANRGLYLLKTKDNMDYWVLRGGK